MDVSRLWLKVTFERKGNVLIFECGSLVVTESKDSLMVQGELHPSQVSGKGWERTSLMGLGEIHEVGRIIENIEDSF